MRCVLHPPFPAFLEKCWRLQFCNPLECNSYVLLPPAPWPELAQGRRRKLQASLIPNPARLIPLGMSFHFQKDRIWYRTKSQLPAACTVTLHFPVVLGLKPWGCTLCSLQHLNHPCPPNPLLKFTYCLLISTEGKS